MAVEISGQADGADLRRFLMELSNAEEQYEQIRNVPLSVGLLEYALIAPIMVSIAMTPRQTPESPRAPACDYCYPPLVEAAGRCLYISQEALSWQDARNYCHSLQVQTTTADLITFQSCNDFTILAGYLGFNVPSDTSYWVGAHTEFTSNNWRWLNGEPLSTGVPFWDHRQGHDKGEDCAAMESGSYFRLADHDCLEPRLFICASPLIPAYKSEIEVKDFLCPDETLQIGTGCYYFSTYHSNWNAAEERCRSKFHHHQGQLFSPASCDEFVHIAHHLEVTEDKKDRWVGAIDVTGNHEWYWESGDLIPGGPPFWATSEPNHKSDHARDQGAYMSASKRFYLEDDSTSHQLDYICKVSPFE
ncbi:uncharacterized protein [Palaemon carinicauda]|uniref:uncharacterized protein n=1 Tax=Palaemon carinicauda TaxID=392227 RepID=UPI0035B67320